MPGATADLAEREAEALLDRLREERSAGSWALARVRGSAGTLLARLPRRTRAAARAEAMNWQPSTDRLRRLVRRRSGRRGVVRVR